MMEVAVGICAYNEAANIEKAIRSIYSQKTDRAQIRDVIVVSSGSTDGTDDIVGSLIKEYPDLKLLVQEKREGKNSAINLFLDSTDCDIVVLLNADNVLGTDDSLEKLILPFEDPKVGIAGGRPIPVNPKNTKIGYAGNLVWAMHHYVALIYPKVGELIAFRDIGTRLRTDLQSDEDIIRAVLERAGYTCVYVPDSIVYNRAPETELDFIKQRVRVNVGECTVTQLYEEYEIPTWNKRILFKALIKSIRYLGFRPIKLNYAIRLEKKCRKLAIAHVAENRDSMSIWDQVQSTKKL